jgi:hypothetical protein
MGSISNYSAGGIPKASPFVGGAGKDGKGSQIEMPDDIYGSHNSSVIVESTRKNRILRKEPVPKT